eukprot:TRINITY_DN61463_c0_g1_i1.p1 TRINITY_DN61463_c0_g1~~TRINITY_DN61463_c0_g1_i1.p1  ORF type:complete len:880 (+),score=120.96 TRINITY_DN61463_c0_g1_i1:47-2641(+)
MSADDEEKDTTGNVDEERENVYQLKSDLEWKKESLTRVKKKLETLEDELTARQSEKKMLESENLLAQNKSTKAASEGTEKSWDEVQAQKQRDSEAMSEYMREAVKKKLEERIPVMNDIAEDTEEGAVGSQEPTRKDQDEGTGQAENKEHTNVMVSLFQEKGLDYKVSFRIDSNTTVKALHEDACAFWGCSPKYHILCREAGENNQTQPTPLWDPSGKSDPEGQNLNPQMQDDTRRIAALLPTQEEAKVNLVKADWWQTYIRVREEKNRKDAGKDPEDDQKASQKKDRMPEMENDVDSALSALSPWPGVQHLMKKRTEGRARRASVIHCRDIFFFLLLLAISIPIFSETRGVNIDLLREGVVDAFIDEGVSGQPRFPEIRSLKDLRAWLDGPFYRQLFTNTSSSRAFYDPVNVLRIRQQLVRKRTCSRPDLPYSDGHCYSFRVEPGMEMNETMVFPGGLLDNRSAGRLATPDPQKWSAPLKDAWRTSGLMQRYYHTGGYMADYSLSPENITDTGETFRADLAHYFEKWISIGTRMVQIEFVLVNWQLDSYISVNLLIEISASGAVVTSHRIWPFKTKQTQLSVVLQIIRGIIVVLYVGCVRVYVETYRKAVQRVLPYWYVYSLSGFLDAAMVAFCVVLLWQQPPTVEPKNDSVFSPFAKTGRLFEARLLGESGFVFVICARLGTLTRIVAEVDEFFMVIERAFRRVQYLLAFIIPMLSGIAALLIAAYQPYVLEFRNISATIQTTILRSLNGGGSFDYIADASPHLNDFTFVVQLFVFVSIGILASALLAATVHAQFEVEILQGIFLPKEKWGYDEWLDWLLWSPVYKSVTGQEPGASQKDRIDYSKQFGTDPDSDDEEDDEVPN